jgi:uncharacterized SAM-binding protein YcdF (DUF218 family)
MARSIRVLIAGAGVIGLALLVGFAVFASMIRDAPPAVVPRADAIVVLTGGEDRIEAGIKLLSEGKGRRLLISGVNPTTSAMQIGRLTGQDHRLFKCCIDFGYNAVDTSSNAEEARSWADTRGYSRLIVVTSSYHMPRSLTEFARVLPRAELVSYPVATRHHNLNEWWHHPATARLLLSEYLKFLTSTARLGMARLLAPWDSRLVAEPAANTAGRI